MVLQIDYTFVTTLGSIRILMWLMMELSSFFHLSTFDAVSFML